MRAVIYLLLTFTLSGCLSTYSIKKLPDNKQYRDYHFEPWNSRR